MNHKLPKSLFISHGGPDLVISGTETTEFLKVYGADLPKPDAIIMVSAHFETHDPVVVSDANPGMIYDFGGFDPILRTMIYPAPGAPQLAERVHDVLGEAGFASGVVEERGYDHGVWVPMMLLRPQADIPIVQLSVQPDKDAAWHVKLGQALEPFTHENILVLGSGSFTHNLAHIFSGGRPPRDSDVPDWVNDFVNWMHERLQSGATDELTAYMQDAPYGKENHPTEEHLHPLFVAMGAGGFGKGEPVQRIHTSNQYGALAMDAYAFG